MHYCMLSHLKIVVSHIYCHYFVYKIIKDMPYLSNAYVICVRLTERKLISTSLVNNVGNCLAASQYHFRAGTEGQGHQAALSDFDTIWETFCH